MSTFSAGKHSRNSRTAIESFVARFSRAQRFFSAAAPVLADLLRERGAVVILDQSQVLLSLDRIDITTEAVTRLDAQIGTGDLSSEPPPPVPAPDPVPAP